MSALAGKRVTVLGLGGFGGGAAAARFLVEQGAHVTITDTKPAAELQASVAALAGLPVRFVLGEHRAEDLTQADLVVKNPAIPPTSPWLAFAREAGVPITSELVLGLERLDAPYVMVTGSKGKSTTAALLGAMVSTSAAPAVVAGNNERPLLDALARVGAATKVVLEVSSFMAEDVTAARARGARFRRPVAVVFTHLEPEHLNWHGTVEAYYEAKLSLLGLEPEVVIFPAGEAECAARVPPRAPRSARVVRVGAQDAAFDAGKLRLLGAHNRENAALAAAAAQALGASREDIDRGVAGFEPLPHRLETVAISARTGVRFVNDSMATTPDAALAALAAVPAPVVLLLGGSDKGHDFTALGRGVAAAAHAAVCLGAVREKLAAAIEAAGLPVDRADSFEQAVALAVERCPPGGTVLLSPATASFDMFPNFKARGERFRALAQAAATG